MFNPVKFAARSLLASVFVVGGLNQLKNPAALGPVVDKAKEQYGVDVEIAGKDLVSANGVGMIAAGTAMALGIMPRTSALALIGMLVPTTVVGHPFWAAPSEAEKTKHLTGFASNAAVTGGLLLVALDPK